MNTDATDITASAHATPTALPAEARTVLRERFGFSTFREGQEGIIDAVLAGRDVLAIMPTGGGKSLCYQLPACLGQGVTLVISPLIALMKDQVDALTARGIPAAAVNSTLGFDQVRQVMDRVRAGEVRLLYVAPERFSSRFFMGAMSGVTVARVAVDEAHCVSQWGHDFRPAYLRIREAVEQLGRPPVAAFTATATPTVQDDIVSLLALRAPDRFVTGFDRRNLLLEVLDGVRKRDALGDFAARNPGPGIVYCATRKRVEEVTGMLSAAGYHAVAYHAGMPDELRVAAQDAFIGGQAAIIVATNAFGMGVDKADVRFVLHYDMPGTLEAYYQEAGRAGRDGHPARCTLLFGGGDRFTQEFFIQSAHPTREFVLRLWDILGEEARDGIVERSHRELLARMGEEGSEFAVSAALKLLEEAEALERLHPRTNPAMIRLIDRAKVSPRAQVQQRILGALEFHLPPGENGAVRLPLSQLEHDAAVEHDALQRALHAMEAAGAITYTPPFRGRGVRLLTDALPAIDFSVVEAKRTFALAALDGMEAYCRTTGCRRAAILSHFGEEHDGAPCGACDRCLSTTREGNEAVEATELARKLLSGVARCRIPGADGPIAFGVQTIAAHLTGGNTESVRRNRLDRLSTHGILKQYTQKQVADLLGQAAALGLLRRKDATGGPNRRPVLELTETGVAVLRGKRGGIRLRLPAAAPPRAPMHHAAELPSGDPGLFEALRALRASLARKEEVPAYMIFPDRALREMAALRPESREAMLAVNGVGERRYEQYGEAFLAVIREFAEKSGNIPVNSANDTEAATS